MFGAQESCLEKGGESLKIVKLLNIFKFGKNRIMEHLYIFKIETTFSGLQRSLWAKHVFKLIKTVILIGNFQY